MTSITGQSAPTAQAMNEASVSSLNADFSMFLKMLTTQLQNQDPLKPMDSTEFTQQLVSYSQDEQTMKSNDKLDALLGKASAQELTQPTAMIGREVTINLPTSILGEDGARWEYSLQTNAGATKLQIVDARGTVVREMDGSTKAGVHELLWDGRDAGGNELPAGMYTLKVEAATAGGNAVQNWVAAKGTVSSVHFENGTVLLDLGGASVHMHDILTVKQG